MRNLNQSANSPSALFLLAAITWILVEQPPTTLPNSVLPSGASQEIPSVPSLEQAPLVPSPEPSVQSQKPTPSDAIPSVDPNSDPLFLEIKKMLMKDKFESEMQSNQASVGAIDLMTKAELIQEPKWQAVHHLMQASQLLNRSVELELAANRLDQAAKDRSVVKQIRVLVLSLLVD